MSLRLDWCSQEAAKYAVLRWHYSRSMPVFKIVRFGVWESDRFVGAIIYGTGASPYLSARFGLERMEVCELCRVALAPGRSHPTSQVVAVSLRLLHRHSPGIQLVISFADLGRGHLGTIYQAGGCSRARPRCRSMRSRGGSNTRGQSTPSTRAAWRGCGGTLTPIRGSSFPRRNCATFGPSTRSFGGAFARTRCRTRNTRTR